MNPRTRQKLAPVVLALASLSLLAACGPQDGSPATPAERTTSAAAVERKPAPAMERPAARGSVGTITAVVPLQVTEPPSGAGAVIGGVVGGALGSAVGKGDGRKAATVLGAVGGAVAGHQVEKDRNTHVSGYRVEVRLDDGRQTSVTLAEPGGLASGQRVRVIDGRLQPA